MYYIVNYSNLRDLCDPLCKHRARKFDNRQDAINFAKRTKCAIVRRVDGDKLKHVFTKHYAKN